MCKHINCNYKNRKYPLCCVSDLKKYTKLSNITIKKYLTIQENLDIRLFSYLDNIKHKLSIEIAYQLSSNFVNPDTQYNIFINFIKKNNKENKTIISKLKLCPICYEETSYITNVNCCNNFICEKCLLDTFLMYLSDPCFKLIVCPFCNKTVEYKFLNYIMNTRFNNNENLWIDSKFKKYINFRSLYFRKLTTIHYSIYTKINTFKYSDISKKIFGYCRICINQLPISKGVIIDIKVKSIEKRCINDQNQLLVIKPELFICSECEKTRNTNQEIKKCPHCSVKTMKPDGCNFISRCKCSQSWCFICSSRLPNDTFGHNHHYWNGNGTSAYDNNCRVSLKSKNESHVIEFCKCMHCIKRNMKPVCIDLNCDKTAKNCYVKYCDEHLTN